MSDLKFNYNSELLIDPKDRNAIIDNYPEIAFALNFEELRNEFLEIDAKANTQKNKSRVSGFTAVGLATLALLTAVFEPVIHVYVPHEGNWIIFPKFIAGFAALAGVAAAFIGYFGVLYSKNKNTWLHNRLATERLRQWHAQFLVGNISAIIKATQYEKEKNNFINRRAAEFSEFKQFTINQIVAEYPRFIERPIQQSNAKKKNLTWIRNEWSNMEGVEKLEIDTPILKRIFSAYEAIRIHSQIQYTSYKLKSEGEKFGTHAYVQKRILDNISYFCVIGLIFLHMLVLIGIISNILWLTHPIIHALAVSSAILALATRTLVEGLRPNLEIERLNAYLVRLELAKQKFLEAQTTHDKIKAMQEIEEAAVEEMIGFLKANDDCKFVM